MSQAKRKFKPEYAKQLFHIAEGDYRSAKSLLKTQEGRSENVVFLAQQSVEKGIKSVLIFLDIAFPLVHDLGVLIALLPDDKMPPEGFNLIELNPYASIRRYEEGSSDLTIDEMEASVQTALAVLDWAKDILEEKNK